MTTDQKIDILECTLRDGSYSVDFKFTLQDTALLARLISEIGFKYVEVGHGVGIGASREGKGQTPWGDADAIRVAREAARKESLIGVFCIPKIATLDDLKSAADAGLDFLRIGYNAPDIVEHARPFIQEARRLGVEPMCNLMKSYALSPEEFGDRAKALADDGAAAVYAVDSAGGMFPEDIERFMDEARRRTDVRLGFHGHNNLHLATANCIAAARHGATLIDTTLYGLGRSAGNATTEVIVAVFQNLGFNIGDIDLFRIMDVAEAYMRPLINQVQMYDMMAVTAGYSQFHSSFLGKVSKAAQKHGVELRRLVAAMGKADKVNCPDDLLDRLARELAEKKEPSEPTHDILISFTEPGFDRQHISTSLNSAQVMIEGMVATSAKRGSRPMIDLTASAQPMEGLVISEFVQADNTMVLGRVRFGDWQVLEDILKIAKGKVSGFLVDQDSGTWAPVHEITEAVAKIVPRESIFIYSSKVLIQHHVVDYLTSASVKSRGALMLFGLGGDSLPLLNELAKIYETIYVLKPADNIPGVERISEKVYVLRDIGDWKHIKINISTAFFASSPSAEDVEPLCRMFAANATSVFLTPPSLELRKMLSMNAGITIALIDKNEAYCGQFARWQVVNSAVREVYSATDI